MNLEKLKTAVLVILVATSLGLTFALWTYQPQYEETDEITYLEENELDGEQQTISDVISPKHIIFHNNAHTTPRSKSNEQQLFQEMSDWAFSELDQYPSEDASSVWTPNVEVVMPVSVPYEMINQLFNVEDTTNLQNESFNRVFFQLTQGSEEQIRVSFTSDTHDQVLNGLIESVSAYEHLQSYIYDDNMIPVEKVELHEDQPTDYVYLTQEDTTVTEHTVLIDELDDQPLKNVLFSNPTLISQQNTGDDYQEVLTDGTRLLRYNNAFSTGRYISYYKPPTQELSDLSLMELLNRSVEHTNDYNGWTNNFNVSQLSEQNQMIQYRLHQNGYPVFDDNQYVTLRQEWANQELQLLKRPLFKLTTPFQDHDEVELPSGVSIYDYLESSSQEISLSLVSDIKMGYQLSEEEGSSNVLFLEPTWFIKYAGVWRPFGYFEERITLQEDG
ncbi:YycH family regulatory protein [Alkalibacillus salilacus]|uniref:Regulatory protein YycH of two-component signal transduction system YycFG n=1 Tax=Alkalibacillus salilacus TaxID=284582 RepID=A0ABT9VBL2_9BACI|nr:two-component system activity regulator YycH [Alkalibacillus salilacus]MDQ0158362.1 regulatory protein YycH of two-component signal transduction system YycFG [Alkalibacillus salilacus]